MYEVFLIVILILIFYIFYIQSKIKKLKSVDSYKIIWMYWENKPGHTKPAYLSICHKTVVKNATQFKIHLLNEKTVHDFLPNLRSEINSLTIPQKADYIRLALLTKYGGIWFDSDTILFQNPEIIVNKLKDFDFVGFGCHQSYCKQVSFGYPRPANWVMGSRENSKLTSLCLKKADELLDTFPSDYFNKPSNYHIFGRTLLWRCIKILHKNRFQRWDYYHFPSYCLDRDSKNDKFTNARYISKENIDTRCVNNMIFSPFYATSPGFPEWFSKMTEDEFLKSDMLVSKMFRKALHRSL